jgi:hypothetical protein
LFGEIFCITGFVFTLAGNLTGDKHFDTQGPWITFIFFIAWNVAFLYETCKFNSKQRTPTYCVCLFYLSDDKKLNIAPENLLSLNKAGKNVGE